MIVAIEIGLVEAPALVGHASSGHMSGACARCAQDTPWWATAVLDGDSSDEHVATARTLTIPLCMGCFDDADPDTVAGMVLVLPGMEVAAQPRMVRRLYRKRTSGHPDGPSTGKSEFTIDSGDP